MLILDPSYVSPLLLNTIIELNIPTTILSKDIEPHEGMNIGEFFSIYTSDIKLLANSEGSGRHLEEHIPHSKVNELVGIFKNKVEFRSILRDLYPNFFYKEIPFEELDTYKLPIQGKYILKPSIGYASVGVYQVTSSNWLNALKKVKADIATNEYSPSIVDLGNWIVEEYIEGDEYAVDAYYNSIGQPVVMNIFHHPFVDDQDLSDKVYYTSKEIVSSRLETVTKFLKLLGDKLHIRNFPLHLEVRIGSSGLYPIEVNALRFAGMGAGDLAHYAYGINIYKTFFLELDVDWDSILSNVDDSMYGFLCIIPNRSRDSIDRDEYKGNFSCILEDRIMPDPIYAITFFKTSSKEEVGHLLRLNI